VNKKRLAIRFPYKCPVNYIILGIEPAQPPEKIAVQAETMDLSNGGMRIKGERALKEGALIKVQIPVSEHDVMVPVLTEVRWAKEEMPGEYQAGLRFLM
jgi:c-di-GMP-binding flagellar brake protein YcgR